MYSIIIISNNNDNSNGSLKTVRRRILNKKRTLRMRKIQKGKSEYEYIIKDNSSKRISSIKGGGRSEYRKKE